MDISFIIPVFNKSVCEVEKCIDSVTKIKDDITYEILLIDDGSKPELQKEYKRISNSKKIKYFYESNQGVSAARNLGINNAKGTYLFFLDADDKIYAENIYKSDLQKNLELIIYSVERKIIGTKKDEKIKLDENVTQKMLSVCLLKNGILNWACGKLYLRKFIIENNIFFDSDLKIGEDWDFVKRIIMLKPTFRIYEKNVYIYLNNPKTECIRNIENPEKSIIDVWELYKKRIQLLNQLNLKNKNSIESRISEGSVKNIFEIYLNVASYNSDLAHKTSGVALKYLKKIIKGNRISKFSCFKINLIKYNVVILVRFYKKIRSWKHLNE